MALLQPANMTAAQFRGEPIQGPVRSAYFIPSAPRHSRFQLGSRQWYSPQNIEQFHRQPGSFGETNKKIRKIIQGLFNQRKFIL